MDCIFCKIIAKKIPAHVIYENESTLAFLDNLPVRMGHTLVVPKKHEAHLTQLDEATYAETMRVAHIIARKIEKEIKPVRVGLMIQGFDVPHVHIHIIPMEDSQDISTCRACIEKPSEEDFIKIAQLLKIT